MWDISSTRGAILREVREGYRGGRGAVPEGQGTGQVSGNTGAYGAVADGGCGRNCGRWRRFGHNGILRLWKLRMMIFGTVFFPFMRGWGRRNGVAVWGPVGDGHSFWATFFGGHFSGALRRAALGVGLGLLERAPWARMLGLVMGFLACCGSAGNGAGNLSLWCCARRVWREVYGCAGGCANEFEAVSPVR